MLLILLFLSKLYVLNVGTWLRTLSVSIPIDWSTFVYQTHVGFAWEGHIKHFFVEYAMWQLGKKDINKWYICLHESAIDSFSLLFCWRIILAVSDSSLPLNMLKHVWTKCSPSKITKCSPSKITCYRVKIYRWYLLHEFLFS